MTDHWPLVSDQGDKVKTHLVEFTSNVVSRLVNVQRRHILVRLSAGGDDQVGGDWNDEEVVAQLVVWELLVIWDVWVEVELVLC